MTKIAIHPQWVSSRIHGALVYALVICANSNTDQITKFNATCLPNMTSFGKSMTITSLRERWVLLLAIVRPLSRDGPKSSGFTDVFKRFCRTVCIDRTAHYRKAITKTARNVVGTVDALWKFPLGGSRQSVHSVTVHRQWRRGLETSGVRVSSCWRDNIVRILP